jgi:hypothetical protein
VIISVRVILVIPETNGYSLVTFWGDETDFVLKSLLCAQKWNYFTLNKTGKFWRTIGPKLNLDVASVHFNLLG